MRIVALIFLLYYFSNAKELQKVSIQLQWLDQFQFAGYYIAKEKGFYERAGLDVDIKKYNEFTLPIKEVIKGKATFGVGRSSLIIDRAKGSDVVAISAIFQTSPFMLLALETSKIESIKDFISKKVMITEDAESTASLIAMIKSQGLDVSKINFIKHSFDLKDLIDGKTDLMASYISNEPFKLEQKGIDYKIFDPKDYGFDIYDDILFTSKAVVLNDPQMVEKFRKASLQGWRYAFDHIDESVDIIFKKYNSQNKSKDSLLYEAQELKKLAYLNTNELGKIENEKIERIIDIYRILGLMQNSIDVDDFIYKNLSSLSIEQKIYLNSISYIKMCVDPFWKPIEFIEDGEHKGLTSDYFKIFSKVINKEIRLVPTESWAQTLEYVKEHKCDIISAAAYTKDRAEYLDFTPPYLELPWVFATRSDANYIYELEQIKDRAIGMVKGYSNITVLKNRYPDLKIVEFDNLDEGLKALSNKKIFTFIDTPSTIVHSIRKQNLVNLKISGQLKDVWNLSVATRNDQPVLKEIFDYAVAHLTPLEKQKLLDKWYTVKFEKSVDYDLILVVSIIFLIILSMFLYILNKLKKSKHLAEESLLNIERILDTTIEGISVSDEKLNIFIINKAALDIFGYTKEEFLQLRTYDVIAPGSFKKAADAFSDPSPNQYELDLIKKDGTVFPALASGKDIIYKGKKARISTIVDLSSLKDTQKELEKLNNELEARISQEVEKNIKREKLLYQQSRLAQMGEMISMIAHQWRQPLSAISLTIVALKLKIDLKKFDFNTKKGIDEFLLYLNKQLDDITNSINNLSATIDDFRNFYKPDKKMIEINITEPIIKSLNIVEISLSQDGIEIVKEFESHCILKIYDSEMMQVVLNILKNSQDNFALKNIKDKKICLRTKCIDKNIVRIEIEDNGGGIDEKIINNIFDPYFSTKDEKNGTGLGLHMSKIIIEEHHKGKLYAINTKDGVNFIIELKR